MLKKLTVTVCACAMAIPAIALGGPMEVPEYGGKLDDKKNHYLGFDVKGSGNDRKIKNVLVVNMTFDCQGGMNDGPQTGRLDKSIDVKANGSFDETITYKPTVMPPRGDGPEKIRYRLAGELDGDKAAGIARIELLGGPIDCDSGKQDFKAKKPSPEPPDPKGGGAAR